MTSLSVSSHQMVSFTMLKTKVDLAKRCTTMSSLFANNAIHLTPTSDNQCEIAYNVIDLVSPNSERFSGMSASVLNYHISHLIKFEDILIILPKPPEYFICRDDVLSEVQKQLVKRGAVILGAQGSLGKPSIAIQFAKQYEKVYGSIFWIPCITAATAVSALRGYAGSHFGLVGFGSMDSADIVSFMCDKLSKFHRYLLVLDNVDEESVLDQILVSTLSGDVVVTSRSNAGLAVKMRKWISPLAKNVRVETWPGDFNYKFLKQ
ncbi:hypothetical protein BJ742DRAFT_808575 [Cladochytrium replicatum]|nr:hypothetical protein BJ742DRAFT_808575 [Cladochytrium replicatum]